MNRPTAERFLNLLGTPDALREVRILDLPGDGRASGYFTDAIRLLDAVQQWDGKVNIYVTLNPVKQAATRLRARDAIQVKPKATTADADIEERRWLFLDIDPTRPSGTSSTEEEREAGRQVLDRTVAWLSDQGWPAPVTAMSGNGWYALYRVDLPNDHKSRDLVSKVLHILSASFDTPAAHIDVAVANASRLIGLVGTKKVKGEESTERPHRTSDLVSVPEPLQVVSLEQLQAVAVLPQGAQKPPYRLEEALRERGISFRVQPPDAQGITWYNLQDCPFHSDGEPYECGVGQTLPDGPLAGKCFHPEGEHAGWGGFRDALGLRAPGPGSAPPAVAPSLAELVEAVPALPTEAAPPAGIEAEVEAVRAAWLDGYINAASVLSPRTPRSFHEACALFAVAIAIARRAYVQAGIRRFFATLLIIFIGRSTLVSKTTGLEVMRRLMREAGLQDLLLPASFTPQALLADLGLHVPNAIRDGAPTEQSRWLEKHRHGAQRAIVRDEVAGLLEDCSKDYNSGLLPLLLKLDGAPDLLDPDLTVSRGLIEVENVCINLIGATTPAALREHAAKAYHWDNGLFGRLGLVAPDEPPRYAFWPKDSEGLPGTVVQGCGTSTTPSPGPPLSSSTPNRPNGTRVSRRWWGRNSTATTPPG